MKIIEQNNQRLVSAVLGVFGNDDASDAVLEPMLLALETAVQYANNEHAHAIANLLFWSAMTPEQSVAHGWRPDSARGFIREWEITVAERRRGLGRVLSLQHEIQKFGDL